MRPVVHAGVGVAGGALIAVLSNSPACGLAFAATSVLMDLDHAVDHILFSTSPPTVANFFERGNPRNWTRLVFALHSHELLLLAVCLSPWLDSNLVLAVLLGFGIHLILDEGGNRHPGRRTRLHPLFYFFLFRLWNGFRPERLAWQRAEPAEPAGADEIVRRGST